MRDVDELLRALEGPEAPTVAPAWPREEPIRRRIWPYAAAGLAMAAAILLAVTIPHPTQATRGIEGPATVDLRMVASRGGEAVRVTDTPYGKGERVYFRLATSRQAQVALWVDGPNGRETVGSFAATPTPVDAADAAGLVAYVFDVPGTYVFSASTHGVGQCPCSTQRLVVK